MTRVLHELSKEWLTCHFTEPNNFKATKQTANFTASSKNWIFPLALRTWFSLAHKHNIIRTYARAEWHIWLNSRSQHFSTPMINKMADDEYAILLLICSHEVWVKVTYHWSTALCLCPCICRPCFHLSNLQHKHKHKKNELVRFSCAYAYVNPVFTCLHMCLCLCTSENQA